MKKIVFQFIAVIALFLSTVAFTTQPVTAATGLPVSAARPMFHRLLTDHAINDYNKYEVKIESDGPMTAGNAAPHYTITVYATWANQFSPLPQVVSTTHLDFQTCNPLTCPSDGITNEALLAIVLDRLRDIQTSSEYNTDTAQVIINLQNSLALLANHPMLY